MYSCPQDVIAQDHQAPTSAAAVTEAAPAGACGFWISVLTQDVRVSLDGTVATATNGLAIKAGTQPIFLPFSEHDLSIIGLNATASDVTIVWVR
jgi:hypothetical protein